MMHNIEIWTARIGGSDNHEDFKQFYFSGQEGWSEKGRKDEEFGVIRWKNVEERWFETIKSWHSLSIIQVYHTPNVLLFQGFTTKNNSEIINTFSKTLLSLQVHGAR